MPSKALTPPPPPPSAASTIFARLERDRLSERPSVAFIFAQAVPALDKAGVQRMNSVGQPLWDSEGKYTTLWTDQPAVLADLEARVSESVRAGKSTDSAEATVAYEVLDAARAAASIKDIAALGYEVRGNYTPWS